MKNKIGKAVAVAVCLLAAGLLASTPAFAYYNRGALKVEAATTSIDMKAGTQSSVSLKVTPSSDKQTEGCGMPKCPQGCSKSCNDKNGQCVCRQGL